MSTVIDRRVVEMKFDNSHFEKNTKESMSTLDKLKAKLNLSGASKGLDNLNKSVNKVDMNPLSRAVEGVGAKFTAMEVIGVTALANLTNSAVNYGKQIVNALTIAPVKDGFQEYELMLTAIQTTMAGTGKTAKEVEEQLKSLDDYADKTVYSTADMLNNLPKFTNAGVELEVATQAMIGIANATALAGGDANKASIAFYNLGQAIGTGYLTRMDYNSINNAGIATMEWKQQMVDAAIAAGTLTEVEEGLYQAGNKVLTIQQLFIDGLQEQWATADVMIEVFGAYGDETTEIGKKAYAAAQNIKSYTMMMDSLKATAGTGWKDTWQIIFGDLDQATKMWTRLTNFISGIIESIADFRNNFLRDIFEYNPFTLMFNKIENSGVAKVAEKVSGSVTKISKSLEYYQDMVNRVWYGEFKNQPYRYDLLTAAGHDYRVIQTLVDKGYKYKITVEDVAKAEAKYGIIAEESVKTTEKAATATEELTKDKQKLTDEQLKAMGLTKEEIKLYRQLEKESERTGKSIEELLKDMEQFSGRNLLIEAFANIGKAIKAVVDQIAGAWVDIFPPNPVAIYNMISEFSKLTQKLIMSKDTANDLRDTFKGLFAIIRLITHILGGGLRIAYTVLKAVLGAFNLDILEFTGMVGRALVSVEKWIEDNNILIKGVQFLVKYIVIAVKAVADWVANNATIINTFDKIKAKIQEITKSVTTWFDGIKEAENIPKYIIDGLVKGFTKGASHVWEAITTLVTGLVDTVKELLGIHSPSLVFMTIGGFIVAGLIAGLTKGYPEIWTSIKEMFGNVISFIGGLDYGAIFTALLAGGLVVTSYKIASALQSFAVPFEEFGEFMEGLNQNLTRISKAMATNLKAKALQSLAISIGILAASIWLLSTIDIGKAWNAVGIIAVLAVILAGLMIAIDKISTSKTDDIKKEAVSIAKLSLLLITMSFSLLLTASALKKIAAIEWGDLAKGFASIVVFFGAVLVTMKAAKTLEADLEGFGWTVFKIATAMLILAQVVKTLGKMKPEVLKQGIVVMALFGAFVVALMAATRILDDGLNVDSIGKQILKMAGAMLLMAFAIRIVGGMKLESLVKGIIVMNAFGALIIALMYATKLVGNSGNVAKIGATIAGIGGAMLLLAFVATVISFISIPNLIKGTVAMAAFGGIIVGLIAATRLVGNSGNVARIGTTIIGVSIAIGILAGVAALLGLMKVEHLAKGITAVSILSVMMSGLIAATKNAQKCIGTIVTLTLAVTILIAAVAGLSLIRTENLASATLAISMIMGMFALIIASTKIISTSFKSIAIIATLIGAVAALAGVLYLLSKIPMGKSIETAASLSLLMAAVSGALVALSKVKVDIKNVAIGVGGLLLLCVPLLALVGILNMMQNIKNAIQSATVLSGLMVTLSLVLLVLSGVGAIYMATGGIAATGILGITLLCAPLMMLVAILAEMQKISEAEKNANLLISLMKVMTDMLVKIGLIGPLALIGVAAMTNLTLLMGAVGVLAVAIGALLEKFPSIETFLDKGIPLLEKLANGIGSIVGHFASGLMTGVLSGLPEIGETLSKFMDKVSPFIEGAKAMDEKAINGIKSLTLAIVLLTAADFISGVTTFIGQGASFAELGTELTNFMKNVTPFITGASTIDPKVVDGVKILAQAVLALTGANLLENITSWIKGGSSLSDFGKQIATLGTDLRDFVTNLGTFNEDQVKTVECAADAVKKLAEAADMIPDEGGLWAALAGDNGLAKFSNQLPNLGVNLRSFVHNLGDFGDDASDKVKHAGKVITTLAEAATKIPNEGGLWGAIAGDNGLAKFSGQLPQLGTDLSNFVTNLSAFTEDKTSLVDSVCGVITKLSETDLKGTGKGLKTLGKNMVDFAEKVADFVSELDEVGLYTITSAADKVSELIALAKEVAGVKVSSLKTFGNSLKSIAKDGVKGFVKEFSDKSPKSQVERAAKDLAKSAIDGLKSPSVVNGATVAGENFTKGFAKGIKNKQYLATNAGSVIGKAALDAAKRALDEHSPSRESEKVGNYFGEGLVIGINDYESKTYKAGYSIAERAKEGLSKAISRITSFVSDGIDTQPTIRPVLDLSNVERGTDYLNSMFNGGPSIGVAANINAISSSMNARRQNGENSDVVSAIDRLRKDLDNVGGTTNNYSFGSISYDDQTALSEAVKTIVRAATMERRV